MSIAKEAVRYFLIVLGVAILVNALLGFWIALPIWLILFVLFYLCRDPVRMVPSAPLGIVSPADGHVILVGKVNTDKSKTRVLIKMGLKNAYVLRSPTEGKLTKRWQHSDYPLSKDTQCNHLSFGVSIVTDEDDEIILFIRGRKFFPMTCYMTLGERIGQGQKCGFTPFGACLEVLISVPVRTQVKVGDPVCAGETILGTLLH